MSRYVKYCSPHWKRISSFFLVGMCHRVCVHMCVYYFCMCVCAYCKKKGYTQCSTMWYTYKMTGFCFCCCSSCIKLPLTQSSPWGDYTINKNSVPPFSPTCFPIKKCIHFYLVLPINTHSQTLNLTFDDLPYLCRFVAAKETRYCVWEYIGTQKTRSAPLWTPSMCELDV